MAQITAQMVKELREATGAGPLDCKKALEQNDGDVQKALDFLREKGLAKAAKKAVKARDLKKVVPVVKTKCTGWCKQGPIVALAPGNAWLGGLDPDDALARIEAMELE